MSLKWNGQLERELENKLGAALTQFGLRVEARAKRKLRPSERGTKRRGSGGRFVAGDWVKGGGHGKRTGTLQRSIHVAGPNHSFRNDSGAQGGQDVKPEKQGQVLMIAVGSGLDYALVVHQNHYDPEVFHFITKSVEEEAPNFPNLVKAEVGRG